MKQEEMDELLKKIEKSAQDVPVPEGLLPEQMMKKLENHSKPNHNRRKWKRPVEFAAIAAAALITVLTVAQIQNAKVSVTPEQSGITAAETGAAPESPDSPGSEMEGETNADPEEEELEAGGFAAKSYQEIFDKIKGYGQDIYYKYADGAETPTGAIPEEPMAGGGASTGSMDAGMREESGIAQKQNGDVMKSETESALSNSTSKEFSDTNVQVEGVDEGDVVKTDGTYLYIMSSDNGRIQILEANGSSPKKRGVITDTSTTREARSIQEFYINGDLLSVIRQAYLPYEEIQEKDSYHDNDGSRKQTGSMDAVYCYAYPARSVTYLETYDISDRDHPKLLGTISQDGRYKSSRRVDDDIYLFTSYCAYKIKNMKDTGGYIPAVNGTVLPCDSIYIPEQVNGADYLVISSVNMKKPTKTTSEKAVLSDGETFYVSSSSIYIGSTRYDGKADQYDYTELMKLSYKNGKITFKAHGNVDGYLNDQFSMDEYQGKLRLVSTLSYNSGISTNSLLVLDENLKVIGEIEDLAPGEQIYSARFLGNTGYFVTFRNMDPLFSVDLTNPKKPKILGELKITGFSEYLHPYDDNLLLGIGREISPDTGNFKGLKLSMFDISNPRDVTEIQKTVEKSYENSPAWENHKAVAISSGKNLVGFAVEEYDKTSRTWNYRYVVYFYDKNQGFKEVLSYELEDDYHYSNVRGLYIGQYFYVVESSRVTVFDMKKFVKAGQVKY